MDARFADIRPYVECEIPAAMQRIADSESFPMLASFVFPGRDVEVVRRELRGYKSVREFQLGVMYWANKRILQRSVSSFSSNGIEQLDARKSYLYISNHRDIMLDAALLQNVLSDNGHETSEITFGANLMQGQMVIDVGKSNKMFKVERPGGSVKEFYKASALLSDYIRHAITKRGQSVWIAQRNGRTKDGIDRTDQGVVKMLGMSGSSDKVDAIAELNVVPVSVSYEWEPCDTLKALELYDREQGPYVKKPGEDLNSILTGIQQMKGNVHFEICKPIAADEIRELSASASADFNKGVANLIDARICLAYRLFPSNYAAHDLLSGSRTYDGLRYSQEHKEALLARLGQLEAQAEGRDLSRLREIFLGIYANPIESKHLFCGMN